MTSVDCVAPGASPTGPARLPARVGAVVLAIAIALVPVPSEAIAPVLLLLLKQIAKNAAESMLKDALLSGLQGMGCKGIALANALQALDMRRGVGGGAGLLGMAGMAGMPRLPAGAAQMPAGMPDMGALGKMSSLPSIPGMPSLPGMPMGLAGGLGGAASPELVAKAGRLLPDVGALPAGAGLGPEQMAMLAGMQRAMAEPLTPQETIATIDELAELGFLPKPIQSELKECMVVLPTSIAALGMGMGMLKPILPQLRQARAQMYALSPAEQDEVAVALADEIAPLPAGQRKEFLEYLGSGFFPPRVAAGVRTRLGAA